MRLKRSSRSSEFSQESQLHFIDSFNVQLVQGNASYGLERFRNVPNPMAVDIINQNVDRIVTVDDSEIMEAMRLYFRATHNVAEGAAAAALAAALQEQKVIQNKRIALIHSGSNVDSDLFASVLARERSSMPR